MMKKNFFIIPLIFLLLIYSVFFYFLSTKKNVDIIPSNLINEKAPIFLTNSLISDKEVDSSKYFKNEIIIINFFATWCKPCRDEHKFIQLLSEENNYKIVGINYKDDPKKALLWLKKLGNPYSEVISDNNGKLAIDWGVYGIPETFIVNKLGNISYRHVGPINKKIYKEINLKLKKISINE